MTVGDLIKRLEKIDKDKMCIHREFEDSIGWANLAIEEKENEVTFYGDVSSPWSDELRRSLMTNEQREAIDRLNKDKNKPLACGDITTCFIDDLDTVLSLLEQKDKQIDLMAEYIDEIDVSEDICEEKTMCDENCKDCVKQYFADKAKIE